MPIATALLLVVVMATAAPAAAAVPASLPTIASFTAAPARVTAGQSSTLRWSVSNATSLTIDPVVGAVTGTSVKVTPATTTSYTLTATNAAGSATATATVVAGSPPTITSFTAAPTQVIIGQSCTLSWVVTGATTVSVAPGVGGVSGTSVSVKPSATTSYTLTAANTFGSTAATVTVTAGRIPTITRFTAAPAKVLTGQSSTLTWAVTGATTLSIDSNVGAVTGTSVKVTPSATTTYALTATNAFGSTTSTATVAAGGPPTIASFTAAPTKLLVGQTSTLSWAVTGATSLTISPGVGAVTGTSVAVKPTATISYTLTAANAFGSTTAAVSVTAGSLPAITSFAANPAKVIAGQSSTLIWTVKGATTLTIDNGVGAVTGTSAKVTPSVTTSYTLTATNTFGSTTATAAVMAGNLPTITSFTAAPAQVIVGQSSTLSWAVSGATALSIKPGVGTVTGTSVVVKPTATTTYALTATNTFGSATSTVTVMAGNVPTITGFVATPAKVAAGQSSTLSWSAKDATTLTIDNGVGAVTGSSVKVKPAATTSYTLTAANTLGSATATVTVLAGSPPTIDAFTATPARITPGQSSTLRWTVTGATAVTISSGLGVVTGTSVIVKPPATASYILTATNTFGSITASVTVAVGSVPTLTSFTATPAKVSPGQSCTLRWSVRDATALSISPGVGAVVGTSAKVVIAATTLFTLTATNPFGSTTATVTVMAGDLPAITSFRAAPSQVTEGQSSTLSWTAVGATSLTIDQGVGTVTGTSAAVTPTATTTYTLTATNAAGSATATATVAVTAQAANPPVIDAFFANPAKAGPGVGAVLHWATTGATSLSIDHGVGTVTGTSATVNPTAAMTYTLTATNSKGSVTATAKVGYVPLTTVTSQLYYSEHALFIIPSPSQVTWTGSNSWGSVYATANINSYVSILHSVFPKDYFFVVIAAANLAPESVPNVLTYRHLADGIGEDTIQGVGVPNICRYHIGTGTVLDGSLGVLDHEIGHNWGVFIGLEVGNGHWLANSTARGQMAATYTDDGYTTVKQIAGDPVAGFTWASVDNIGKNETEVFSEQDLYLQGFSAKFPDLYVLDSPVYQQDHTVSYSAVAKYDQAWVEQKNGVRYPSYRTSDKRLLLGLVYVARDLAEVQAVYQPIESSINQFVNAEQIDTAHFRFQVPFLVETLYRASLDALLADLDGNATPTLSIPGATYLVSADGSAVVPFTAADSDGPAPVVSCVPASPNCSINGTSVVLAGLASGTHFFTIKAQDGGGKKTFAHFVIDVQ